MARAILAVVMVSAALAEVEHRAAAAWATGLPTTARRASLGSTDLTAVNFVPTALEREAATTGHSEMEAALASKSMYAMPLDNAQFARLAISARPVLLALSRR